mmetsp:Transcript_113964/g.322643  ORF Transcript_113964/g.322643 Transcript_113964/m.322643 type:complete len:213 (-) Transcript_113964:223-861(-)
MRAVPLRQLQGSGQPLFLPALPEWCQHVLPRQSVAERLHLQPHRVRQPDGGPGPDLLPAVPEQLPHGGGRRIERRGLPVRGQVPARAEAEVQAPPVLPAAQVLQPGRALRADELHGPRRLPAEARHLRPLRAGQRDAAAQRPRVPPHLRGQARAAARHRLFHGHQPGHLVRGRRLHRVPAPGDVVFGGLVGSPTLGLPRNRNPRSWDRGDQH